MKLYLGNNQINKIAAGNTVVNKIGVGSTQSSVDGTNTMVLSLHQIADLVAVGTASIGTSSVIVTGDSLNDIKLSLSSMAVLRIDSSMKAGYDNTYVHTVKGGRSKRSIGLATDTFFTVDFVYDINYPGDTIDIIGAYAAPEASSTADIYANDQTDPLAANTRTIEIEYLKITYAT